MNRVSFFIDGFNLYHAIADKKQWRAFKWLNLSKLASSFLKTSDTLSEVYYFTSYAYWKPDSEKRHKIFINAQEFYRVKPVLGNFRPKTKHCSLCKGYFKSYEEKETDVNIAIQLFEQALKDTFDTAIILSGDSDQIPTLEAMKKNFPGKKFGILIPPGRQAEQLKKHSHFYHKIKQHHLASCQLPDSILLPDGRTLSRPSKWKQVLQAS